MDKKIIITSLAAAFAVVSSTAFAADELENCKVVNKDGKGLIKEHKADCKTAAHNCAGHNPANDPESWIKVPKGQCVKINAGDFSEVSPETKDKIEGAK